jgi:hypothetical protein
LWISAVEFGEYLDHEKLRRNLIEGGSGIGSHFTSVVVLQWSSVLVYFGEGVIGLPLVPYNSCTSLI